MKWALHPAAAPWHACLELCTLPEALLSRLSWFNAPMGPFIGIAGPADVQHPGLTGQRAGVEASALQAPWAGCSFRRVGGKGCLCLCIACPCCLLSGSQVICQHAMQCMWAGAVGRSNPPQQHRGRLLLLSAPALLSICLFNNMQVTCMDSRLIPENMFGFKLGDAEIIRNAGGRVNSDVIRFASHLAVPAVSLLVDVWPAHVCQCCSLPFAACCAD